MTARAVTVSMLKGGTTKSTVAAHTAEALSRQGKRVLAIDTDPNGHLTTNLGHNDRYYGDGPDLGDVILESGSATPNDIIVDTGLGFDLIPSTEALETVESNLRNQMQPSMALRENIVEPLLGDVYDHIVIDTHSSRNMLVNNAVVAAPNLLVPVTPEQGIYSGLRRTRERIIDPLQGKIGLDILAFVPNKLRSRIDQRTDDRELFQRICTDETLAAKVPNFAYISPEQWEAIDAGELSPLPKPGIRFNKTIEKAYREQQTLGAYAPDDPGLEHWNEVAKIVIEGEVVRDD
jgi:chromosome partitioning protein